MAKISPMMEQYLFIKNQHKEHIVFFRLGDFYEMFFEDALLVSKELELTLTGRDCGQEQKAPMCGVPYHSSETYIRRLIEKGYKVAVCEQMEEAGLGKGIVTREVVRIVTPGTLIEDSMLDDSKNNFLCSIYIDKDEYGFCSADISTGEMFVTAKKTKDLENEIINELTRFSPAEIIFNDDFVTLKEVTTFIKDKLKCVCGIIVEENNNFLHNVKVIKEHFIPEDIADVIEKNNKAMINSVGSLIDYVNSTQKQGAKRLSAISQYQTEDYLDIDITARRNLELTENLKTRQRHGTLLGVIDKTRTAMGKRFIRKAIEQPLLNLGDITRRHNAVEELFINDGFRDELVVLLDGFFDIERIITKVLYNTATPRDVKAFGSAILKVPQIKKELSNASSSLIKQIDNGLCELGSTANLIKEAIEESPPVSIKDGGLIKAGFNSELDEYRNLKENINSIIDELEQRERDSTGIKTLKIGYNRVFGYYIEITKSNMALAPMHYVRKQTLANCERYITSELKELEDKVLSATDKIIYIEGKIFSEILIELSKEIANIQQTATSVAYLDFLVSLASVARVYNYVRPTMVTTGEIDIVDGRHAVVEQVLQDKVFIANDTFLDVTKNKAMVITGPNMSGKSTYMRQVALIVILAQMGSFVPAKSAKLAICDKLFTRIGASDDLSSGQSTFMVEMNEVAHILKNATPRSLIILDEVGRGTSTFDGMSIAKAVIEHIVNTKSLSCKTLFATHYHELTELENEFDSIKNLSIAVQKNGDDITFLRKIVKGPADDSYGIEVAKLAGVTEKVIIRAKQILAQLEGQGDDSESKPKKTKKSQGLEQQMLEPQIMLDTPIINPVVQKLAQINVDSLTPIEALNLIYQLKKLM